MKRTAFLAAVAALALAGPGLAQDESQKMSGATEGPALSERLELCATCHGEDGRPVVPDVPIIWGQEFFYLYTQLKDYAAGRREHDIMSPMAAELSRDEMKALAQHFSEQKWPSIGYRAEDAEIRTAKAAETAGQCVQCHLGGYDGESRVPRLAGQKPDYLQATMLAFKHRDRNNAPDKSSLLASFDDESIAALASYLAGI